MTFRNHLTLLALFGVACAGWHGMASESAAAFTLTGTTGELVARGINADFETPAQTRGDGENFSNNNIGPGWTFNFISSIGLERIPGLDGIDTSKLYSGEHVWLWLLSQAAWSMPAGSILRAERFIPTGILGRIIQREKEESAVGFPPGSKKSMAHYTAEREAVEARRKSMGKRDRLQEWDESMYESEQRAEKLLDSGFYVSTISMDPFTASAALLDLIAFGPSPSINLQPPQPPSVVLNGPGEPIFVMGKEKLALNDSQFDVVQCVCEAGESGVNKDELVVKVAAQMRVE